MSALAFLFLIALASFAKGAITYTPFGTNAQGGSVNGQSLFFGSGGEVFELDAFLRVDGHDLNGALSGTAAQLSQHSLPPGLAFSFASSLSGTNSDLTLNYSFTNTSGATLPGLWFGFFVDSQIDEPINTYFNEAAAQFGTVGVGAGDSSPDEWEADEPGYTFGNVIGNLSAGQLDGLNAVPSGTPDDVSLALGFQLGALPNLGVATISIFLSDDGDTISDLALQAFDTGPDSFDDLTLSGITRLVVTPEPSGLALAIAILISAAGLSAARSAAQLRLIR